jgi:hypothetical protein
MVQLAFNAHDHDPSLGAGSVLENGVYSVQIVSSEVKQTKAGTGYMLVFELSLLDPGFVGRKLTVRLNIHNPNAQAVEIAYRELSAISHVTGILQWQDTQQLHGRPFKVSVEKVPRQDKPDAFSNNVIAYMDYSGNPPSASNGSNGSSPIPPAPPAAPPAPVAAPVAASAPVQPPSPVAMNGQPPFAPGMAVAPAPAPAAAP